MDAGRGSGAPQCVELLSALQAAGWRVTRRPAGDPVQFHGVLGARYPRVPHAFQWFLDTVAVCVNPSATVWFLGADDYAGRSDAAFAWNECERQSVAAADGDEALLGAVDAFWSRHLPFLMSVKDGYAFAAISLGDDAYGAVVVGREPEYEDVDQVCTSFGEFADAFAAAVSGATITGLTPFCGP